MTFLRLTGALLLIAPVLSPQASDPVIRVDVNLRQVDLIVTDTKGNHVSDLLASDFQLLEDGKPQQITNFSWVEITPPPSGARLAALHEKPSLMERYSGVARLRKTPGNDVLASPAANLRRDEVRRVISILAGDSSTPVAMRIRKFIDEQVGPGDMVSVRSPTRTIIPMRDSDLAQVRDAMGIFQQFTNDKRQLDAATERLPRVCTYHLCFTDVPGAFVSAIQSLQSLPGRKALLFVGRYKGPTDNIITLANRAGVVIYVLDPMGVVIEAETVSDAVAPKSERLSAEKTGGRRILSTAGFDLTTSFNEVIEDLSGYYLLGYHPAADDSALKSPPRHRIEVRVLRPGLTVRVRDGLMGTPDPVGQPDSSPSAQPPDHQQTREQVLTKALFSAFTEDGIRVHLESLFAASKPDRKKKRSPLVRAQLDIEGRDLSFTDSDGGKQKVVLDVVAAVFNEDGTQAGAVNKAYTFAVSKEKAAEIVKAGLQYRLDVPLSGPGPYQVRAAVRDANSGEVGSAYAFVDIPDFNGSRISLSSLVLTPSQPGNEFESGATVDYLCEVFGMKTPDVETEIKFYRGGGPVADIPPSPAKIENVGDQSVLSGSLQIPDNLAAGNYTMELLAYDRHESSKKKQAAEQWIDITVANPRK